MTIYTIFLYCGIAGALLSLVFYFFRKPENILLDLLKNFCGSLFIFSGLVKAVDPIGTALKMEEYFDEFVRVFSWPLSSISEMLKDFATPFSIAMIVLEIVLGVTLILGVQRKWTSILFMAIVVFFTLLTGFTYLTSYSPGAMSLMLLVFTEIGLGALAIYGKNKYVRFGSVALALLFLLFNPMNLFMAHGEDLVNGKFDYRFYLSDFFHTDEYGTGHWKHDAAMMRVTDCGCFGDFIKLKPKMTFSKDLFLLLPSLLFVLKWRLMAPAFSKGMISNILVGLATVGSLVFCVQNTYWDEPIVDFRPFKKGVDLLAAKKACLDDRTEKEMTYVYVNQENGKEVTVTSKQLSGEGFEYLYAVPDQWKPDPKRTTEVIVKEGCDSKVRDFELTAPDTSDPYVYIPAYFPELKLDSMMAVDAFMESVANANPDYSGDILNGNLSSLLMKGRKGYQLLIVANNLKHSSKYAFTEKLNPLVKALEAQGIPSIVAYAGANVQEMKDFRHECQTAYPFVFGDEKLLKTMCRSNPGILLLKDGVVMEKWHWKKLPTSLDVRN